VSLPAGTWVDVITQHAWTVTNGSAVPVADLLGRFPVALLERS
jgi:maltooligosyltrehalose synthase